MGVQFYLKLGIISVGVEGHSIAADTDGAWSRPFGVRGTPAYEE